MFTASLTSFLIFLFFWNISPGPMVTLLSRNSVKYSFKGGFAIMIGILMCDLIYLILAFLGIASVISKYETIFFYAKILGSFYILYIGASIFLNAKKEKDYTSEAGTAKIFNFKNEVIKGFLTNLSNPLTIVGMASFILPFFKPEMNIGTKMLYAFFIPFSTFYCFGGVTLIFGNPAIRKLILPKIVLFERIAGIVISYMAIMIIISEIL